MQVHNDTMSHKNSSLTTFTLSNEPVTHINRNIIYATTSATLDSTKSAQNFLHVPTWRKHPF